MMNKIESMAFKSLIEENKRLRYEITAYNLTMENLLEKINELEAKANANKETSNQ